MTEAFEHITILDLTRLLPGAVATQYFSDHGAEVIKVEQPGMGDYARTMNPVLFARTNAGKKSVCLDLKDPRGKEILLALASEADVFIEGFRPGVLARLGLAYDDLRKANPALIYASLTGYGQHGPLAALAGHDINYIAMGGLLGLNLPVIPGVQIADLAGGAQQAIVGILTALYARSVHGRGQFLDISMTAGVASLLTVPLATYAETGFEPEAGNELLSGQYACYHLYQAKDGRWLAVGALEPKFWAELCRRLGCEDLISTQFDLGRQPEVKTVVAALFATKSAAEWFSYLKESDCCVTPVLSVGEVAQALPPAPHSRKAPGLGEHTSEVLARLKSMGAIA